MRRGGENAGMTIKRGADLRAGPNSRDDAVRYFSVRFMPWLSLRVAVGESGGRRVQPPDPFLGCRVARQVQQLPGGLHAPERLQRGLRDQFDAGADHDQGTTRGG